MPGKQTPVTVDISWEKELAPKVTFANLFLPICMYALWTGLLAYIAFDRWFGALQ